MVARHFWEVEEAFKSHDFNFKYKIFKKKGSKKMKLTNIKEVNDFLAVVDSCEGSVTLTSPYGDRFNLKSKLTQYIAIAELLGDNAEELELWCSSKADEYKFLRFLSELNK